MSHLTCTNCGEKSPDTATRCKHCGRAFGRTPERPEDSDSRRNLVPVAVLLAGAALAVLAARQIWPKFSTAPSAAPVADSAGAPPETPTVAAPAPAPSETRAAPAESVRPVPPSTSRPPEPARPAVVDTAVRPAAGDTAGAVAPTPAPQPVSIDVEHQRYAQVWANLRAERNNTAPILQVLHPGQIVSVDSLDQGWYRVTTDRPAVGYVDQQYLDTLPPRSP